MQLRKLLNGLKAAYSGSNVARRVQYFNGWTDRASAENASAAGYDHTQTVKEYYSLCNEFMVFGWGESLHFAPLSPRESLEDSKIRHQRLMIAKLDLHEGMTVVDIGCGIGGPMRRVVREAGVRVVGVNNNEIQLDKAKSLNTEAGLDHMVDYLACSFMDMSAVADNTFDRGYAIESTCHAPEKAAAFAEIYRVLKPGALFWGQEMCITDKFDPDDNRHRTIEQELMHGIALKDIATMGEVDRALETVGFQVIEGADLAVEENGSTTPWYQPMETRHGTLANSLYRTRLGRKMFNGVSGLAEMLGIFPKGSMEVLRLMDRTANAYVAGGRTGIFTPLYCFLARKPL
ncbi:MAG: methyltransferase domain-containing protein [Candidatus Dadabacteria bacterium]|nr:methyltransferase domain-containing protein [Candidatus Dadabacteria bacterium]MYA48124.1 methyltransferase domain-containing protein [Candidatus Dadabacteria bacterium]MYF47915.1 methyltransferase domain-containing protein [Candidatus Dadabacteria bacterium]MYG83556.1 methyltransferase domain-containing protein [Candidatus Dadabacteria bacterium]MYK49636.1 methyltransferase domain-containing protein [Candidatus Dadabacteria bacterium]